jgi:uncharacterized metal-binding protein YceD (DUF177 family)
MGKNSNNYVINFKGLEPGQYDYEFQVGDKFFESYGVQDFRKGDVKVKVELLKESTMLVLNFDVEGSVELECDRCLDLYDQQVKGEFKLIVKFGEEAEELTDEIIVLPFESYQIDLSQFFYEYIALLLPMKHVHPDDEQGHSTCNQEMIQRLESLTVKSDMRWDALKNIKFD